MSPSSKIEFFTYENDPAFGIQLEPEANVFTIQGNEKIQFVAIDPDEKFQWSIRAYSDGECIQLFPDGDYSHIQVFVNDVPTDRNLFLR